MLTAVIGVHIAAGLAATLAGAAAMFAPKRPGPHPRRGQVYLTAVGVLFGTALVIVAARPHVAYLLLPGGLALTTAATGYIARRIRWRGWLRHHLTAMGTSYVALLTAFYVDNGPRLPIWNLLPPIVFWFLPTVVGLPLIGRALNNHPSPPSGVTANERLA